MDVELFNQITDLALIAESEHLFVPFREDDLMVEINNELYQPGNWSHAFNLMNIPNTRFQPNMDNLYDCFTELYDSDLLGSNSDLSREFTITLGLDVSVNSILQIVHIVKMIYEDDFTIYFRYNRDHVSSEKKVVIGSYIVNRNIDIINVSRAVDSSEILNLKYGEITREELSQRYPNINYSPESEVERYEKNKHNISLNSLYRRYGPFDQYGRRLQ